MINGKTFIIENYIASGEASPSISINSLLPKHELLLILDL